MSVLVDTHAFLWFVFDDPRLSARAHELIGDPDETKLLSVASLWEIAVKLTIAKLRLGMTYDEFLALCVADRGIELLPIELPHLSKYTDLPMHHRDPFDRLLIAQCQVEGLPVVTRDARFGDYGIDVLW